MGFSTGLRDLSRHLRVLTVYGVNQVYDFVPHIIPGGLDVEGEARFLCETLQPDGRLSYFIAADGRYDVDNDIALFTMEVIREGPSLAGFLVRRFFLSIFFPDLDSELRRSISVSLSVAICPKILPRYLICT